MKTKPNAAAWKAKRRADRHKRRATKRTAGADPVAKWTKELSIAKMRLARIDNLRVELLQRIEICARERLAALGVASCDDGAVV